MLGLSTGVHRGEIRRGRATVQLDPAYPKSSLSEERRTAPAEVRAGDRAPHGTADGLDGYLARVGCR